MAGAFDLAGRLALWPRSGHSDLVAFTEAESPSLRGLVVTHNHPDGYPPSAQDAVFAAERDVVGLRAVCSSGLVFELLRPERGWPPSEEMEDAADRSTTEARHEIGLRRLAGGAIMREEKMIEVFFVTRQRAFSRLGVVLRKRSVWEEA